MALQSGTHHRAHAEGVPLWPPDLLGVGDLTCIALGEVLDRAARMKAEPGQWTDALAGEALACFFDAPTTGVTVATGAAADRLGMLPAMLPRDELLVGGGEPIADIARTFSATAAAIFVHTFPHDVLADVAEAATVPVINALSDEQRPLQALSDLLTLREHFGRLEGLVLAFVGNASDPAAHSIMEAGAIAAMDVRIACPPGHGPSSAIRVGAEAFADLHGGRITITDDVEAAVDGADAVYTTAWVPPGKEAEREERREHLAHYQVHPGVMKHAKDRAVFMHTLPARRGEEVDAHVIDGARSVVWEQAANRVPVEEAVLHALITAHRTAA
jgi:ornithine carbamoyltransferase